MELIDWIYAISAGLSAFAAVLAWIAKIRWSNEYKEAKDEVIRAKDAHIERLQDEVNLFRDLTSGKLREFYKDEMSELEVFVGKLQESETSLIAEVGARDTKISELEAAGEDFEQMRIEKEDLESQVAIFSERVNHLESKVEAYKDVSNKYVNLRIPQTMDEITYASDGVTSSGGDSWINPAIKMDLDQIIKMKPVSMTLYPPTVSVIKIGKAVDENSEDLNKLNVQDQDG